MLPAVHQPKMNLDNLMSRYMYYTIHLYTYYNSSLVQSLSSSVSFIFFSLLLFSSFCYNTSFITFRRRREKVSVCVWRNMVNLIATWLIGVAAAGVSDRDRRRFRSRLFRDRGRTNRVAIRGHVPRSLFPCPRVIKSTCEL